MSGDNKWPAHKRMNFWGPAGNSAQNLDTCELVSIVDVAGDSTYVL